MPKVLITCVGLLKFIVLFAMCYVMEQSSNRLHVTEWHGEEEFPAFFPHRGKGYKSCQVSQDPALHTLGDRRFQSLDATLK